MNIIIPITGNQKVSYNLDNKMNFRNCFEQNFSLNSIVFSLANWKLLYFKLINVGDFEN